jgi:hypothetical protein
MKLRQGFVSNSSSASFVIKWDVIDGRDIFLRHEKYTKEIIYYLFGARNWGNTEETYAWLPLKSIDMFKEEEPELCEQIDRIVKNTIFDPKFGFTTDFLTAMHNDFRDFGKDAPIFLMALMVETRAGDGVFRLQSVDVISD